MIGTITNTAAIVAGAIIGSFLKKGIREEYKKALFIALGLCSLALGFNACCQNMPNSQHPVLFILSLALGALAGYILKLDQRFRRLVDGKKAATHTGEHRLSEGLSTGILLYCIGTFSIIGPVLSALYGDNTYLFVNSTLDLITSSVLATTYGIGMIWAAPVLFCWQGMFYMIAKISENAITDDFRTELCIIGGVLIAASGLSILGIKDCKVINMLPAFFVVILFFVVKSLIGTL